MKESEYIIATNRVKVSLALHALRDVIAGDKYGVSETEISEIKGRLYQIEESLFNQIKTTEG